MMKFTDHEPILREEFSIQEQPKPSVSKMWKKALAFGIPIILLLFFLIPTIIFSITMISLKTKLKNEQYYRRSLINDLKSDIKAEQSMIRINLMEEIISDERKSL